ncbi:MAG: GatB/YqeY domain-containing protein [Patescibacteria group bacterium]
MLHEKIKSEMKEAMKAKEAVRLSVIRGLLSAFTNEAVAKGRKPDEMLTDDETLAVLKRASNQRKDATSQYRAGGREDLAINEEAELIIIQGYLPEQMSREEIKKIASTKIAELGADKSKIGQLTGAVMKETAGRADGGEVKSVLEELLT